MATYETSKGINRLRLQPISRAASEQRAGRAGRVAPGRCFRLWTEAEQSQRRPYETPEILRLDLSASLLEIRAWGLAEVSSLSWIDPPRGSALESADALLRALGAVGGDGSLTNIGRRMLEFPAEPRIARMLIEAEQRGCGTDAVQLAALASERDILLERRSLGRGTQVHRESADSDLLMRAELFQTAAADRFDVRTCDRLGIDARTARTVERLRSNLSRSSSGRGKGSAPSTTEDLLRCVLAGYPDRVCKRREKYSRRAVTAGGAGVELEESSVVRDAELFVAVELDAGARTRTEPIVRVASAIEREWLEQMFPASIRTSDELVFDRERRRIVRVERTNYLDLTLEERVSVDVDRSEVGPILVEALRNDPSLSGPLLESVREFLDRIRFLVAHDPRSAGTDVDSLVAGALEAACDRATSLAEIERADLSAILAGLMDSGIRNRLDREVPTHLRIPSGRMAPIHYDSEHGPTLSARIQELFGLAATPRVAGGTVPVTIELLAPNQRPVQITRDLASFWTTTYVEVRKQLRGRYPKHDWPEDPRTAVASSRIRRR